MTAATCALCSAPTGDGLALCSACTGRLERDLADLAAYVDELHTALARMARVDRWGGVSEPEPLDPTDQPDLGVHLQPDAYDVRASETLDQRSIRLRFGVPASLMSEH